MVRICDGNDLSLQHMVSIPKVLYGKRLHARGWMKNLPAREVVFDDDGNPLDELLETNISHFEPLVTIVVKKAPFKKKRDDHVEEPTAAAETAAASDADDGVVCRMDRFWQSDLGGEVIVNTKLRYSYEYPKLKDPHEVMVIPLERFLEGYLFSEEDVYPAFTTHLEDVLSRSLGGWIAMKHLFCVGDKKSESKSPGKKGSKKVSHRNKKKKKKSGYLAYTYPNASTAVAKFLEVDVKEDIQRVQLEEIKRLIGYDVALVPVSDDAAFVEDEDEDEDRSRSSSGEDVNVEDMPAGDGVDDLEMGSHGQAENTATMATATRLSGMAADSGPLLLNVAADGLAQLSAAAHGSTGVQSQESHNGVGSVQVGDTAGFADAGDMSGGEVSGARAGAVSAVAGGTVSTGGVPRNVAPVADPVSRVSVRPEGPGTLNGISADGGSAVARVDPATFESIRASMHSLGGSAGSSTRIRIPGTVPGTSAPASPPRIVRNDPSQSTGASTSVANDEGLGRATVRGALSLASHSVGVGVGVGVVGAVSQSRSANGDAGDDEGGDVAGAVGLLDAPSHRRRTRGSVRSPRRTPRRRSVSGRSVASPGRGHGGRGREDASASTSVAGDGAAPGGASVGLTGDTEASSIGASTGLFDLGGPVENRIEMSAAANRPISVGTRVNVSGGISSGLSLSVGRDESASGFELPAGEGSSSSSSGGEEEEESRAVGRGVGTSRHRSVRMDDSGVSTDAVNVLAPVSHPSIATLHQLNRWSMELLSVLRGDVSAPLQRAVWAGYAEAPNRPLPLDDAVGRIWTVWSDRIGVDLSQDDIEFFRLWIQRVFYNVAVESDNLALYMLGTHNELKPAGESVFSYYRSLRYELLRYGVSRHLIVDVLHQVFGHWKYHGQTIFDLLSFARDYLFSLDESDLVVRSGGVVGGSVTVVGNGATARDCLLEGSDGGDDDRKVAATNTLSSDSEDVELSVADRAQASVGLMRQPMLYAVEEGVVELESDEDEGVVESSRPAGGGVNGVDAVPDGIVEVELSDEAMVSPPLLCGQSSVANDSIGSGLLESDTAANSGRNVGVGSHELLGEPSHDDEGVHDANSDGDADAAVGVNALRRGKRHPVSDDPGEGVEDGFSSPRKKSRL